MMSTVLMLSPGPAPKYRVTTNPSPAGSIGCVYIDEDFRVQSSDPQALLDLATQLTNAAELMVLEQVAP